MSSRLSKQRAKLVLATCLGTVGILAALLPEGSLPYLTSRGPESQQRKLSLVAGKARQSWETANAGREINYLAFGTSVTWGAGLVGDRFTNTYPKILSPNAKNLGMRAAGPYYPAMCVQSLVTADDQCQIDEDENEYCDETIYDVILLEYVRRANDEEGASLRKLASRLATRYPDALLLFVSDWHPRLIHTSIGGGPRPTAKQIRQEGKKWRPAQDIIVKDWNRKVNKNLPLDSEEFKETFLRSVEKGIEWNWNEVKAKNEDIVDVLAKEFGGYVVNLPRPEEAVDFIDYIPYFAEDFHHLSDDGHAAVAEKVLELIDELGIVQNPRLGPWTVEEDGSGAGTDSCVNWFETGFSPLSVSGNNITMQEFSSLKFGLNFPNGGSIVVHNPFDAPMSLHLSYMTTGPPPSIYPPTEVTITPIGTPPELLSPSEGNKLAQQFKEAQIEQATTARQSDSPPTIVDPTSWGEVPVHPAQTSYVGVVMPGDNAVSFRPLEKRDLPFRLISTAINPWRELLL